MSLRLTVATVPITGSCALSAAGAWPHHSTGKSILYTKMEQERIRIRRFSILPKKNRAKSCLFCTNCHDIMITIA